MNASRLALAALCTSLLAGLPAQEATPGATPAATAEAGAAPAGSATATAAPSATDKETTPTTPTPTEAPTPTPRPTLPAPKFEGPESKMLFVDSYSSGLHSPAEVANLAATIRQGGFNRIIAETRALNGMVFPSRVEATLTFAGGANFDPIDQLQKAIGPAVEVWPQINTLPAFNARLSSKPPRGTVLAAHPEFTCLSIDGTQITPQNTVSLDPGNPAAQDHLVAAALEVVNRYHPKGIVFANFIYPGKEWGYSESAIAAFRAEVGGSGAAAPDDPTWCAWRRAQLQKLIHRLRTEVTKAAPGTRIALFANTDGGAPSTWDAWTTSKPFADYMQDWAAYAEGGAIDELILEDHRRHYQKEEEFTGWIEFARSYAYKSRIAVSLSGELNFPADVFAQVRVVRSRGLNVAINDYAAPAREAPSDFFKSLATSAFTYKPGAPGIFAPTDRAPESRAFSVMPVPPPGVEMKVMIEATPSATPTPVPTPEPTMDMATPIPTPTPDTAFSIITLENGKTVRARVVREDKANGEITLQTASGAPFKLPLNKVKKIERAK